MFKSIGFIGGGRVARIMLGGLNRKRRWPGKVIVSDVSAAVLDDLKQRFPKIETAGGDLRKAAAADVVFLALHPPAISGTLADVKSALREGATVVSLAPRISIARLSDGLDGVSRIVRMIPNAPSMVNKGFNPVAFHAAWPKDERKKFRRWINVLGDCPEVAEDKLEAYAVITAMGPTCLWFQFDELEALAQDFGMTPKEAREALLKMWKGALKTIKDSGLSPAEVMDLVPLKPLGEEEANIRNIYRTKLQGLYDKLKS